MQSFNPLFVNNFNVILDKVPSIQYSAQDVSLPDINITSIGIPTPFLQNHATGDRPEIGELSITFMIDEDLINYRILLNWIRGLSFPTSYEEYDKFIHGKGEQPNVINYMGGKMEKSDITVAFLTNKKNENLRFHIKDCFPVSLTGIDLTVTNTAEDPLVATCTFSCRDYTIEL